MRLDLVQTQSLSTEPRYGLRTTSPSVTKLLAPSGATLGTYSLGTNAAAQIAFDGSNIRIVNSNLDLVTKIGAQ
jgi:hypothetical protein